MRLILLFKFHSGLYVARNILLPYPFIYDSVMAGHCVQTITICMAMFIVASEFKGSVIVWMNLRLDVAWFTG